jgi:DNA-3-methyladenine glycosylase II
VYAADYWDEASSALGGRDSLLAGLIVRHRGARLSGSGDAFTTLANAIVGQQISVAAASGIWGRLSLLCPGMRPQDIASAGTGELRSCGLSGRKVEYLQGIAKVFLRDDYSPASFDVLTDDEVRARLCALRGVGPWTAEMFLIFHLHRPDVLPVGDIGLQRAASRLYGWPAGESSAATRGRLSVLGESWRPWRTVAVWYLWRDLDVEPVVY